jgi:DUF2075 family protein
MYCALKIKNASNKARLVAGYSWDWPTEGRERRGHTQHVTVGGLSLPWNFNGENWATAADGISQVGCVHTCQGVEFDWLGVLIGPDLRFEQGQVIGDPAKRAKTDSSLKGWKKALREARGNTVATEAVLAKVQAIIKNTYKVLLSRGRKGCFVWCADPGLRQYFRDRLRLASSTFAGQATITSASPLAPTTRIVVSPPGKRFEEWVPVYELRAAAGGFGPTSLADCIGWIEAPPDVRTDEQHFVAQVHGRSMEPLIPDGSLCLFRLHVAGSRNGRILLVQHHAISDPDLGGSYTVKKYQSLKVKDEAAPDDAAWTHAAIKLVPANPQFQTIWISPDQVDELRVVAEFLRVVLPGGSLSQELALRRERDD